jgi:asparagine synthase (glutamine-hydrolysing)
MCGILGSTDITNQTLFESALQTLAHRGPNGRGVYYDGEDRVALGHTRLSIIDLSERGRQPLSNEDGTIWLTFNGEIYNFQKLRRELLQAGHQFRSETDSEVIVHAYEQWGDDCVLKFDGMFAFAIWDSSRKRIFLARDRAGIKPLFIRAQNDSFSFASEPRALLALHKSAIHWKSVGQTLQYGYSTGTDTVWENIRRLSPGHVATYDLNSRLYKERCYWNLPRPDQSLTLRDIESELPKLLENAISKQLVSDVPIGVFLSGGIDSSLVSGIACKKVDRLQSFTLGFRNSSNSEHEEAAGTAKILGTKHLMQWHDEIAGNALQEVFDAYDEPLMSRSLLPTFLVCRHAASHCRVMLSGDGGDEVFGGYRWYRQMQSRPAWYGMLLKLRGFLRAVHLQPAWPASCASWDEYYRLIRNPLYANADLQGLFPRLGGTLISGGEGDLFKRLREPSNGYIRQWQLADWKSFLVDDNLMRVDRASMYHGMEVRVPLLDETLVQFVLSIPEAILFDSSKGSKWLLRDQLTSWAPDAILNRRKTGFSGAPTQFYENQYMEKIVRDGVLASSGLLDVDYLTKSLEKPGTSVDRWSLFVLENWAQRWMPHASA